MRNYGNKPPQRPKAGRAPRPELPSGGQALSSMGENLTCNGFTGSANLSIGHLAYDSNNGNGPFGLGFGDDLSSKIHRRTTHGTPTYNNSIDTFMLDGEVLVP